MGRRLVAQAFLLYSNALRDRPQAMVCLLFMCNMALDGDDEPAFFMGNAALAEHALGRPEPSKQDLKAVQRCLASLREVGAITTTGRPAPGRRMATYRLHLDAPASMERTPLSGVRPQPDSAETYPAQRGKTYPAERGIHVPRSAGYKAPEVDKGTGKTRSQGAAPATRTRPPNDAAETFARNGLKAGRLRSIDGGRAADAAPDATAQLPLLGLVHNEPSTQEGDAPWSQKAASGATATTRPAAPPRDATREATP